ncbi:hypothetical protein JXO59_14080 [candidate division KSB1 bacterium]|nr:hypothetical protein [candidate division KSB1 bacterium]
MKKFILMIVILSAPLYFTPAASSPSQITTPETFFSFQPGADRMLIDYEQLIAYLQKIDDESPRLKMIESGITMLDRPMYLLFISSPQNITELEPLKEINKQLALNPDLTDKARVEMLDKGRVFLLATLSMHSTEVGPSQALPLIAYRLATADDAETLSWLDSVVYMAVPCHNPDGMDMVVNHYRKYKGSKYEGSSFPGIYHKYVGHNINRDFLTLSQEENKAVARVYSTEWYPQVLVQKHQMGSSGPRYFVPPVHDPIAENLDAGLYNWSKVFGSSMINDMTDAGLSGVSHSYIFDSYWPGDTETSAWKNVISMLTELASVNLASPIYIEPNELAAGGKGLAEYKKSINMPAPWPGGWWRLSDLLQYEITSTLSMMKTAARYRKEILQYRNDLCRSEVAKGLNEAPHYYILPAEQHDTGEMVDLVNLLMEHGVRVYILSTAFKLADRELAAGTVVVPLSQPYRAFVKEVMEAQQYPVRRFTPGGEIIRPYDITTWSLPLHRGVKARAIDMRSEGLEELLIAVKAPFYFRTEVPDAFSATVWPVQNNTAFKVAFQALKNGLRVERLQEAIILDGVEAAKGSFVVYADQKPTLKKLLDEMMISPIFVRGAVDFKTVPVKMPRIALVETYFHDMDAGWTRYVFDRYGIPYTVVRPGEFEKTAFVKNFDILIFPDEDKSVLMDGKYKRGDRVYVANYPPEFARGIGKKGYENVMTFLDKGGKIISWGQSTELFLGKQEIVRGKEEKEEFQLPVRNVAENLQKAGLNCPGSWMKVMLTPDHPLTLGMPEETGVFYRGRPAFTTSIPGMADLDRRVIARFPEKDILLSGYCEKEESLAGKVAMAWARKGSGQVVLMAFSPQFRGSTQACYKLLFNAILL